MTRALAVFAVIAACHRAPAPTTPRPPAPHGPIQTTPEQSTEPPAEITWQRVRSAGDIPPTPPPAGTFRVHLIDVGTGLAILVQGNDFSLLYDAGTNDAAEKPVRVLAYLAAALGASGDGLCVDRGQPAPRQRVRIDHVVLSHPHADHGSAMDLVIHCYDVANMWDSGRVNQTVFYREIVEAIGRSVALHYHTAADVPSDHVRGVKGVEVKIAKWDRFSEGDTIRLGESAAFTILHAEGKDVRDINENSIVIAVSLGGARMLLVGDAPAGEREDPSASAGEVEQFLLEQHGKDIRADILQVGHHGSKTSSRRSFLDAVKPHLALVSSGPKVYGKVRLPDREVIDALGAIGATILRTDEHDASCDISQRLGGDSGPGGCDSYVITIAPGKVPDTAQRNALAPGLSR